MSESSSATREQLAGWIQKAGFACSTAPPSDALAEARQQPPQVAVIGVKVPDDGGMWIVRSLRTQTTRIGVVVVTTPGNVEVAHEATRLGAVDCLPWPSSEQTVVGVVRRAAQWRDTFAVTRRRDAALAEELEQGRRRLQATLSRVDPEIAQSVLLALLESRSPALHDHVTRVAQSAAALARAIQLSPGGIRDVRTAALLHEVGKIAAPQQVLAGTTPLSHEHVDLLRSHVAIGAEVLAAVPTLASIAPVVAAVHERYDGSGYPHGLAGEAIPLGARIVAVADIYDRLTAGDVAREPLSHDDAVTELIRGAGSQVDPDVVRHWVAVAERARCS